jgi:enediyne polyketide synthase
LLHLDPSHDLYGEILFHQGRFRRVEKYHLLEAGKSVAELTPPAVAPWYARHLPAELVAGDPSSRDAALHSIQACIPHKTILPVGIDRVVASAGWTHGRCTAQAIERLRDGNDFIYDVMICDERGQICERWEGLHLHAVAPSRLTRPLASPLLGPYLERMLGEINPAMQLRVMLVNRDAGTCTLQQMLGPEAKLTHRADGKPEISGCPDWPHISFSHCCGLSLIVGAKHQVGCDLERVAGRESDEWKQLLGENFAMAVLIAEKSKTSLDTAATQVWTLKESLRKAGASFDQALRVQTISPDGRITLSAAGITAALFRVRLAEKNSEFALGFVVNATT